MPGYAKVLEEIKRREHYLPLRSFKFIPPAEFDRIFRSSNDRQHNVSSLQEALQNASDDTLSCILKFVLMKNEIPAERESLLNAIIQNADINEGETNEMDRPPLSLSEIITNLTKQSVGLLYWKNHCQATVTCVGENLVLTPAHVFYQGDDDLLDHLIYKISTKIPEYTDLRHERIQSNITELTDFRSLLLKMKKQYNQEEDFTDSLDEMKYESFERKLKAKNYITRQNIKDVIDLTDDLISIKKTRKKKFNRGDIKIHPAYVQEAEILDHKDKNCCGYTVDEVVFINFDLDVAILKISMEHDFPSIQPMVPMLLHRDITVGEGQNHCHIVAHPFHKSLSVKKFVKLLDERETKKFAENYICLAIIDSIQRNCSGSLDYVPKPQLPMMILRSVSKSDRNNTCCQNLKISWDDKTYQGLCKQEKCLYYAKEKGSDIPTEMPSEKTSRNVETPRNVVLDFDKNTECQLGGYKFPSSKIYIKSTTLQIPIPKRATPYRFIVTEQEKQRSLAIEIDDNKIKATSIHEKIIVEERMSPLVLSVISKRKIYKCCYTGQNDHPLCIAGKEMIKERGSVLLDFCIPEEDKNVEGELHTLEGETSCCVSERNFSITLRKDKKGRHSLHYMYVVKPQIQQDEEEKGVKAKNIFFCIEEKTRYPLVKTDFKIEHTEDGEWKQLKTEHEIKQSEEKKYDSAENLKKKPVDISCDKKQENDFVILRRKRMKRERDREKIFEVKYEYIKLKVKWNEDEGRLEMKTEKIEETKSRKIKLRGYEHSIWQVKKLPQTLQLLFSEDEKGREKSCVKVKLISSICKEHTEVHFEPTDNRVHMHFLRLQSIASHEHEVPGQGVIIDHKLHGRPSQRELSRRYVPHLQHWLNHEQGKKLLLNEEKWEEAYRQYQPLQSPRFQYLQLIDMEHGASGGPCFEFHGRNPLLKGILLGACPHFYYNDENLRLFFKKCGICFNKILPVCQLKQEIEKNSNNVEVKDLDQIPETWELKLKNSP